jgi:hypothetical protein
MKPGSRSHARRDKLAQGPRREAERTVRKRALAVARVVRAHGGTTGYAAELIGLKAATLVAWQRDWRLDRLQLKPLGRPQAQLPPDVREAIQALYTVAGAGLSLDYLRDLFPFERPAALEALRRPPLPARPPGRPAVLGDLALEPRRRHLGLGLLLSARPH